MAEHKGGRPISGSQRPTGGDKALMSGGKRQFFRRRKVPFKSLSSGRYPEENVGAQHPRALPHSG